MGLGKEKKISKRYRLFVRCIARGNSKKKEKNVKAGSKTPEEEDQRNNGKGRGGMLSRKRLRGRSGKRRWRFDVILEIRVESESRERHGLLFDAHFSFCYPPVLKPVSYLPRHRRCTSSVF